MNDPRLDPYYPRFTPEQWRIFETMIEPEIRMLKVRAENDGLNAREQCQLGNLEAMSGQVSDYFLEEIKR